MTNRRILIVDDERLARRNLELALDGHPDWELAGACASAAEARKALDATTVDLVLLDIRMPGESGLALAHDLSRRPDAPILAFVTAYDEHAVEAFDLYALDYLLKPFDDARFAQLLDRARLQLDLKDRAAQADAVTAFLTDREAARSGLAPPPLEALTVRSVGRIEKVEVGMIRHIVAAGNYVELHLGERIVLHRATMSALAARLPADFIRVHRTAIVRRDLLRGLQAAGDGAWRAILAAGETLPVSETHVEAVRRALAAQ